MHGPERYSVPMAKMSAESIWRGKENREVLNRRETLSQILERVLRYRTETVSWMWGWNLEWYCWRVKGSDTGKVK